MYDIGTAFQLYLYPNPDELAHTSERQVNFAPAFVAALEVKLGLKLEGHALSWPSPSGRDKARPSKGSALTPEDVFHYAYALFHSLSYRTRYVEFLKIDFPRLPLTGDRELFFELAKLGAELVGLHLLESPALGNFITEFPNKGSNLVERVTFAVDADLRAASKSCPRPEVVSHLGRVWINKDQFFGGVPEAVWNFHIGGY